ncbi:hypothetical protein [Saccharothrix sp. HUAS TT1]|uniref:hypothetical protein n=1 Tax=unclassified Saccharothrix TaxID=2593673 RepID=UPI00345C5C3B
MAAGTTAPPAGYLGTRRPGVYKLDTPLARAEQAVVEFGKDVKHRAKQAKSVVYKKRTPVTGGKVTRKVKVAGRAAAVVTRAVAGTAVVTVAGTYIAGRQVAKHTGRAYRKAAPVVRKVAGHAGRKIDAYATAYGPAAAAAVGRGTAKARTAATKATAKSRATAAKAKKRTAAGAAKARARSKAATKQARQAAADRAAQARARARNATRVARQRAAAKATGAATTAYAKGKRRKARVIMRVAAYVAPKGTVEASQRGSVTRTDLGRAEKAEATAEQWAAAIDAENAAIARARATTTPPPPVPPVPPRTVGRTDPLPPDHPARRPAGAGSPAAGSPPAATATAGPAATRPATTRTTGATAGNSGFAGTGGATHNHSTEGPTMSGALAVQQFNAAFRNLNAVEPDTYHDWLYTLVGTANALRLGSELTLGLALRMDIRYRMDPLALQHLYLAAPALATTGQLIAGSARDFYAMYQDRIDPAPLRGRTMANEGSFFPGSR